MKIYFEKYQSTGNDFIIIDNRKNNFPKKEAILKKLCDRKFGVGSDGIILLEKSDNQQFTMFFYNPDGTESFCGNGARAAIRFAESLEIINEKAFFKAYDGPHNGKIEGDNISLQMSDVKKEIKIKEGFFLDTGVPHFVLFVKNIHKIDVLKEGRKWRNSLLFGPHGANINFVEIKDKNKLFVRTYERGVENETLSCGTGVTASALVSSLKNCSSPLIIETKGGLLNVNFDSTKDGYANIWLKGPSKHIFSGAIYLSDS